MYKRRIYNTPPPSRSFAGPIVSVSSLCRAYAHDFILSLTRQTHRIRACREFAPAFGNTALGSCREKTIFSVNFLFAMRIYIYIYSRVSPSRVICPACQATFARRLCRRHLPSSITTTAIAIHRGVHMAYGIYMYGTRCVLPEWGSEHRTFQVCLIFRHNHIQYLLLLHCNICALGLLGYESVKSACVLLCSILHICMYTCMYICVFVAAVNGKHASVLSCNSKKCIGFRETLYVRGLWHTYMYSIHSAYTNAGRIVGSTIMS